MGLTAAFGAVVKGIITVGKFLGALAPKAGAIASQALIKAGASAATAQAVGGMVKSGVALAEIKALDKITDATIEKIPVAGKVLGDTIDTIGIMGVLRQHLK